MGFISVAKIVEGILSKDKANAYTYTSRSWVPEGLFSTTLLTVVVGT